MMKEAPFNETSDDLTESSSRSTGGWDETSDSTEKWSTGVDAPSPSQRNRRVVAAVAIVSLLAAIATIVVISIDGNASDNMMYCDISQMEPTSDNMMYCDMSQMEPMGLSLFSMAPANMSMTDDMMAMDSMMLSCAAEGRDPAVYMKVSSEKVTMDSGATQTIWHGAMMGESMGFATLVQTIDGTVAGTFTTEDAAYSVMTDPNGTMQMKMTPWADFPDGAAANATTTASNSTTDIEIAAESFVPPMVMNGTVLSKDLDTVRTVVTAGHSGRRLLRSRQLQTSTVRVLLIVTDAARCEYAGLQAGCAETTSTPFDARVPLLQDEMNRAMQSVGVPAEIQIVNVVYLQEGLVGGPDEDTLE